MAELLEKSAEERFRSVEGAARKGSIDASVDLALALIHGDGCPRNAVEGTKRLHAAAEAGSAEADAIMALVCAIGAGIEQSWRLSLEHLFRSAQRGWRASQVQVLLLAKQYELLAAVQNNELVDWHSLSLDINIQDWLNPPSAKVISSNPKIYSADSFIDPYVCKALIASAHGRLGPAEVYDVLTGDLKRGEERTNSIMAFSLRQANLLAFIVRSRIAAALGTKVINLEPTSILHYSIGQKFTPHYDFLDPAHLGHSLDLAKRGQRIATFLIYLNDEFEGGETEFPKLGIRARGKAGTALFFVNVTDSGEPDWMTQHAGLAPTKGEKWIMTQFVREQPQGLL